MHVAKCLILFVNAMSSTSKKISREFRIIRGVGLTVRSEEVGHPVFAHSPAIFYGKTYCILKYMVECVYARSSQAGLNL